MIEELSEKEKGAVRRVCGRILLDNQHFSDQWVSDSGLKILVAENVMHPGGDELEVLAAALRNNTSGNLFGISIPEGKSGFFPEKDEILIKFTPSVTDMESAMMLFAPFNFLLFSGELNCAILFLKDVDIKFIVGSMKFLQGYGGDIVLQKRYFEEFRDNFLSHLNNSSEYFDFIEMAYSKMDWIV